MSDSRLKTESREKVNFWLARFREPAIEVAYRQEHLEDDKKFSSIVVGIAVVVISLFFFSDPYLLRSDSLFYPTLIARILFTIGSMAWFIVIRRTTNHKAADAATLLWAFMGSIFVLFVDWTRSAEYVSHMITDIVFLLAIMVLLTNKYILQMIAGFAFTVGLIVLYSEVKSLDTALIRNVLLAGIVLINLFAVLISHRNQLNRRIQYFIWIEEKQLSLDLQKALAEIKTLRGIIPICANCKKIRDDKGFWNQLEAFIHEHSDAEFSHGICPQCAAELYPEDNDHDS